MLAAARSGTKLPQHEKIMKYIVAGAWRCPPFCLSRRVQGRFPHMTAAAVTTMLL